MTKVSFLTLCRAPNKKRYRNENDRIAKQILMTIVVLDDSMAEEFSIIKEKDIINIDESRFTKKRNTSNKDEWSMFLARQRQDIRHPALIMH